MLSTLPDDVVVATDVVPDDGRPIPELVVGPFGVAIVHELGSPDAIRRVGSTWEMRDPRGWEPTESPLDRVNRDVERVRHWMTNGDLDFVVHVYAALVTDDPSIPRSSLCAVITADQIPAWFAALPAAAQPHRGTSQPPAGPGPRGPRRPLTGRRTPVGEVGRGARTRTWNQRDISPPL